MLSACGAPLAGQHIQIPIDDPEDVRLDILPILISEARFPFFPCASIEGTGFLLGDGVLVTCHHCIAATPPTGSFYAASRHHLSAAYNASPIGFKEHLGQDVGWARVNYRARLGFRLATQPATLGADVWTFGYPLPEKILGHDGQLSFIVHPRLLQGHVVRRFGYMHPQFGSVFSYELSFAAPPGLSGAPLFLGSSFDVVGMIYGNNDVSLVEESARVDPDCGIRTPEVHRVVSFGPAHHLSLLRPLADKAKEFVNAEFMD